MWEKVNIVFRLKSPLHIGYMPFRGSVVSPTRYYVPGRGLWGAITKRITEYLCEKNHRKPEPSDYKEIGKQIIKNFRFSYFYLCDEKMIYFPRYTDEGVKYGDNKNLIPKSEFERRFIGSLISTAIESNGVAKDKSLHEIEFINSRFKDENGNLKDVKIAGCIWIKNDAKIETEIIMVNNSSIFIENFNIIEELILGGESKYGFGHVILDSVNQIDFSHLAPFKWKNPENVEINDEEFLVAHLKYSKNLRFNGDIELLTGRGYFDPKRLENDNNTKTSDKPGEIISKAEYYFSPGTILKEDMICIMNWDGTLILNS